MKRLLPSFLVIGIVLVVLCAGACQPDPFKLVGTLSSPTTTLARQSTITKTAWDTFTPTLRPLRTMTPWNTYVVPTSRPTRTPTITPTWTTSSTITPYGGTPTNTPFSIYAANLQTIIPTSTYRLDPTEYPADTFANRCHDLTIRIRDMAGRNRYSIFDLESGSITRIEDGFNPQNYFNILTHIRMEDGYVLDYLYSGGIMGGGVILYARETGAARFATENDLINYLDTVEGIDVSIWRNIDNAYLEHVVLDGTPTSFLEYSLFLELADQFYLFWHELYNDNIVMCLPDDLDRAMVENLDVDTEETLPEEIRTLAEALDFTPIVQMGEDVVEVRLIMFSKFEGFTEYIYWFSRDAEHELLDRRITTLIPYNCGWAY